MCSSHFQSEFIVVYLRVVQGCNLNCAHCFTLGNKDPYQLVDLENVRAFLKQIRTEIRPKKAVIYIHGGETFLAPLEHLAAVNQVIREEFFDVQKDIIPQTNLMYEVDDRYLNFIESEYNGQLGVSWDYKIRFGTADKQFGEDLFFTNFRKLIQHGLDVAVAITVQKNLIRSNPAEWLPRFEGAKSIDFEFLTLFDTKTRALKVQNEAWSDFYFSIVKDYVHGQHSWSMPQVDLFTKSFIENKIFSCKGNCCQNRTFTLNCNGSIGLCPDQAYFRPISNIAEFTQNWPAFERKARESHLTQQVQPIHPICMSCEFFDCCGGNCEPDLFDASSTECPLSQQTLRYQKKNLQLFVDKLNLAKKNLVELREVNAPCP